jgi:hypothetical protein
MELRRRIAARTRERVNGVWPIMPGSERVPADWPGWPDGKKFAVVLTHDVEGQLGLNNCRVLMEIELALGFRSSFNFIPEGSYTVPPQLRKELVRNGFEVGIHDLRHDGRLFASRRKFSHNAARINTHIREMGAVGFRAGFMMHQLDWLHELNIQYDASTFDTDPFEPQPHGRRTIFPFWVPAPASQQSEVNTPPPTIRNRSRRRRSLIRHSAVEPADMYLRHPAQDSTLFLLLGEKTASIWEEKLDWIAHHGGMALMIAHPDYMAFTDRVDQRAGHYPIELYIRFLEHIRSKYSGDYWQALPRDVAAYYSQINGTQTPRSAEKQVWHSLSAST